MGTYVRKHKGTQQQKKNLKSKPHMCTDEKNAPMNADEKGKRLTLNCTGLDFRCICSVCVTLSVGLHLSMVPCLHFASFC